MLQIVGTILFFVVFVQLMVALSLYIWLTFYELYKKIKQNRSKQT